MGSANINVGNKVLFVGGPEAGNVRIVPEADGNMLQADNDYVYRIWPVQLPGDSTKLYFAYPADQHPIKCFLDMWREYAPAAQIKRGTEQRTYQKLGEH